MPLASAGGSWGPGSCSDGGRGGLGVRRERWQDLQRSCCAAWGGVLQAQGSSVLPALSPRPPPPHTPPQWKPEDPRSPRSPRAAPECMQHPVLLPCCGGQVSYAFSPQMVNEPQTRMAVHPEGWLEYLLLPQPLGRLPGPRLPPGTVSPMIRDAERCSKPPSQHHLSSQAEADLRGRISTGQRAPWAMGCSGGQGSQRASWLYL